MYGFCRLSFTTNVGICAEQMFRWKPIKHILSNTLISSINVACLRPSSSLQHDVETLFSRLLVIWSWIFRYIHVALDTFVLYGVLRERNIDERGDGNNTGSGSGVSSGRRTSGRGMSKGSRGSSNTSKPVTVAPLV